MHPYLAGVFVFLTHSSNPALQQHSVPSELPVTTNLAPRPVLELRPEEHHRVMAVKNRGEVPPGHLALPLLLLLPHQHRPILLAEGPHLPPRPGFAILCRFPSPLLRPPTRKSFLGLWPGTKVRGTAVHPTIILTHSSHRSPPHSPPTDPPLYRRAHSLPSRESSAGSVFLV